MACCAHGHAGATAHQCLPTWVDIDVAQCLLTMVDVDVAQCLPPMVDVDVAEGHAL